MLQFLPANIEMLQKSLSVLPGRQRFKQRPPSINKYFRILGCKYFIVKYYLWLCFLDFESLVSTEDFLIKFYSLISHFISVVPKFWCILEWPRGSLRNTNACLPFPDILICYGVQPKLQNFKSSPVDSNVQRSWKLLLYIIAQTRG